MSCVECAFKMTKQHTLDNGLDCFGDLGGGGGGRLGHFLKNKKGRR